MALTVSFAYILYSCMIITRSGHTIKISYTVINVPAFPLMA